MVRPAAISRALANVQCRTLGSVSRTANRSPGGNTIRGVIVNYFVKGAGILIHKAAAALESPAGPPGPSRITDNYIGTNAAGTNSAPNGVGIHVVGVDSNTISENLVSGNKGQGIWIESNSNTIDHNNVGTDRNKANAIPNLEGIEIEGNDNKVGPRNVISGNHDQWSATREGRI